MSLSKHFVDDPLRVLRLVQFSSRFDMSVDNETLKLCNTLLQEFDTLPKERIWGGFEKWCLKSTKPSRGLDVLKFSGWIFKFPDLGAMLGLQQEPEFHPEGTCLQHLQHCIDHCVEVCNRDNLQGEQRIVMMFAVLCHDLGKATTTKMEEGVITSRGHDTEGELPTIRFLEQIGCPPAIIKKVVTLVVTHMFHVSLQEHVSARVVRRFANRLSNGDVNIRDWIRVVECDHCGRPPKPKEIPSVAQRILDKSLEMDLATKPVEKILLGRHMIDMGFVPGKEMGNILREAFEAQLEGLFGNLEEALVWVKERKN